jgi:hypothetical protein
MSKILRRRVTVVSPSFLVGLPVLLNSDNKGDTRRGGTPHGSLPPLPAIQLELFKRQHRLANPLLSVKGYEGRWLVLRCLSPVQLVSPYIGDRSIPESPVA